MPGPPVPRTRRRGLKIRIRCTGVADRGLRPGPRDRFRPAISQCRFLADAGMAFRMVDGVLLLPWQHQSTIDHAERSLLRGISPSGSDVMGWLRHEPAGRARDGSYP